MRIAIVGQGYLGTMLSSALAQHYAIDLISSRATLAGQWPAAPFDCVILAHGRSVNVVDFDAEYDNILSSRTSVAELVIAECTAKNPNCRFVLLSSSVAYITDFEPRTLPSLQTAYERHVLERCEARDVCILRLGAVLGAGAQITEGIRRLARTVLIKRLRLAGPATNLPWAQSQTVVAAVSAAIHGCPRGTQLVAESDGLDINRLLDEVESGMRLRIGRKVFFWIWELLGVRKEFFLVDLLQIRLALTAAETHPRS